MRGVFNLHDPASQRMDVAVDQLVDGTGFEFERVWFFREHSVLRCWAISPWSGPGLSEAAARKLIAGAHVTLAGLIESSPAFAAAVAGLSPNFAIIDDYDIGAVVVVELVDDKLVWNIHEPKSSAD